MPYVHRNTRGEIESLHRSPTLDAVEYLPQAAPALHRFLGREDAKGLPDDRMVRTKVGMEAVPNDVALELAKLDLNETSVALARGSFRRLLMLCGREPVLEPMPTRDQVREQVINQKLEGLAEGYLEELRSAAIIREP